MVLITSFFTLEVALGFLVLCFTLCFTPHLSHCASHQLGGITPNCMASQVAAIGDWMDLLGPPEYAYFVNPIIWF